jgi:hypothetical protein
MDWSQSVALKVLVLLINTPFPQAAFCGAGFSGLHIKTLFEAECST